VVNMRRLSVIGGILLRAENKLPDSERGGKHNSK